MSGVVTAVVGQELPIVLQLPDGETGMYPQAEVYDNDDNNLTTLSLEHKANGFYAPASAYSMPDKVFVVVVYIVYTDSGHTTESSVYLRDLDVFRRNDIEADWANGGRLDTILDAVAVEANVQGHTADALIAYDPPTRTEATADKNEIIAEVDANETKIDAVQADTNDIQTRLPAALVGGRMDSDVGHMQAGTVSAAVIATDAVDADALAVDAVAEIQSGLAVPGDQMNLVDDAITLSKFDETTAWPLEAADTGANTVARTGADTDTLETLSDQIDALNDLAIADVQTAMTNQGYTAARAPNLDNLDVTVSSRAAPGDAMDLITNALDAAALAADAVTEIIAGVWSELVPGAFGAGSAGYILGTNLDIQVSTRAVPGDAMGLVTDALDAGALAASALAELNTYLEVTASHGAGSWQSATVSPSAVAMAVWSEAVPGTFGVGEAGYVLGMNLDALISSRSSHSAIDVDTQLSGVHGSGSWEGDSAATIDALLTVNHGAGSWATALVDLDAIASAVWEKDFSLYTVDTQMGYIVNKYLRALVLGDAKQDQANFQWVVYDPDDGLDAGATELARHDTFDASGNPSNVQVYTRKLVP